MRDEYKANIRIADYPEFRLQGLTAEAERVARLAGRETNQLWRSWCRRWPDMATDEVMARVAFRFAQLYFTQREQSESVTPALDELERSLDEMLRQMVAD